MKKYIAIAITLMLTSITCDNIIAGQRNQEDTSLQRKHTRQRRSASQRSNRRVRGRYAARRKKAATPEEIKQATNNTRQLKADTKRIQVAAKKVETAPTPAKKQEAQKELTVLAQELLTDLEKQKNERSLMSDIYSGYEPEQQDAARKQLEKLLPLQEQLKQAVASKQRDLDAVTDKGWIWNAAKPGNEGEYNKLSQELSNLQEKFDRINRVVRNQNIIAGEEWSNAYRALLAIGVVGTAAATANVALYGSAGMVGQAALSAKEKIGTGLTSAKNWVATQSKKGPWEWSKLVAGYGVAGAGTALTLLSYYNNAQTLANLARAAYKAVMGDPKSTPQQRKDAQDKLDKAEKGLDRAAQIKADVESGKLTKEGLEKMQMQMDQQKRRK